MMTPANARIADSGIVTSARKNIELSEFGSVEPCHQAKARALGDGCNAVLVDRREEDDVALAEEGIVRQRIVFQLESSAFIFVGTRKLNDHRQLAIHRPNRLPVVVG